MENKNLESFKNIVLKAMNLKTENEIEMFNAIPDHVHSSVFKNNFNENLQLSRKIIYGTFDQDDYKKIEVEKLKINDMTKAARHLSQVLLDDNPILFLTDTDNDGSLAQANIIEFEKSLDSTLKSNVNTLYCQTINGNSARGFTVDLVDAWIEKNPKFKDANLTIVSADNGINSRDEQEKINKKYPNAMLIVTDHHLPDEDGVVLENKNTMIVNPKYKPNKFFESKNISGANVLGVLLEKTLNNIDLLNKEKLSNKDTIILNMREISRIANLLDYVDTDISDKPLQDHLVEKYSTLGGLMNVNNSLNKIITSKYSDDEIKSIFENVENIDIDKVIDAIHKIQEQNKLAEKILTLQHRYLSVDQDVKDSLHKESIYQHLIIELDKEDLDIISNNINPNFIEQLRPYIYNYSASTASSTYENGIQEAMINVYTKIKVEERILQNEFGKTDILKIEKLDNATVMYPKSDSYLKLLNRKLLGKIFNEENNGILMILNNIEKHKATGSFRSTYRIQDILKNKKTLEEILDVKISFQGHDKAAGFFVEANDGKELNGRILADVTKFLSKNISNLKENDVKNYSHLIQTNLDSDAIGVFSKYNQTVKGNLTNMNSLSPVIQFNKSTYLTHSKTQKENSLQDLVADKKYGYIPVEISFDGKTIILPTELLRQITKSNFKDAIQVSFMNDGVFIGNRIIPNVNKQNLYKIKSKSSRRDEMIEFFNNNYKDNNYFTSLPIDFIEKSPFFKFNKYGENEYARFEETILTIIDRSDVDMIVVADTEANGLGNAPKISNFGVVELMPDPSSGSKIKLETFKNAAFKTMNGKKHLLNKKQISEIRQITKSEYDMLPFEVKQNVIINLYDDNKKYITESTKGYKDLRNTLFSGDTVIVNRSLKTNIGSIFIKDRDVKISERIKTLTDIDNTLLNKIGILSEHADKALTNRYKDKKIILQAHNLPYDLGVIKGNLKNFYEMVTDFKSGNLLNDSALYSRVQQLAYDPIDVAGFDNEVPALSGIQFFHSEQSDLSLDKFLSNKENGVLPDRTGRYVLEKKNEKVIIIDTKTHTETNVSFVTENEFEMISIGDQIFEKPVEEEFHIIDQLKKSIKTYSMPKNAIKYSVQALSDYDMIRTLILSNSKFKIKPAAIPEVFGYAKSHLEFFMMNYHFDSTERSNLRKFSETLTDEDRRDIFFTDGFFEKEKEKLREEWLEEQRMNPPKRAKKEPDFGKLVGEDPKLLSFKKFMKEFLEVNKDLQGKFHDTWAYKKVLTIINPVKSHLKDEKTLDIIAHQASLSKEKVKEIMEEAIEFKETFGIEKIIQKEPHNNVFFDECDVVMEGVLTFKRPTDRNYNSYTHNSNDVVEMYMENIVKTCSQHMVSQLRRMALDSFSKKQADSYSRRVLTKYIAENQKIDLSDIKFKFSASTLPSDTFAYGILKEEISQEKIEEISKKLEFVARNEQMVNSVSSKLFTDDQQALHTSLVGILKSNENKVNSIKDEMTEYLEKVYYSRKENDMKKALAQSLECILENADVEGSQTAEPLRKNEKTKVVELSLEFLRMAERLGVSKIDTITQEEENDIKGFYIKDIKSDNLNDFVTDALGKDKDVLEINHPLARFLLSVNEISEEDHYKKELENDEYSKLKLGSGDNEEQVLARNKIMDTVKINRRDDSKHLFEFNELLSERLSELRLGKVVKQDCSLELEANRLKILEKEKKKAPKVKKTK